MDIKFIGQGLDPESDHTAGNFVIDSLTSNNYSKFNAFVAFVSLSGLNNVIDQMLDFVDNKGGQIRLYVGVNLHATSKEALEKLLENNIETYIVYSPNSIIYHPKIYAFEGKSLTRAIVGSSNFTASGLFQNIEASVCVDFDSEDENGNEFLTKVYDHFNSIIDATSNNCQRLTQELLDLLIDNKVVLSEVIIREKNNKVNSEFAKADAKARQRLLEKFGKITPKRPPKGFKNITTKKNYLKEENSDEVRIVEENILVDTGSMWIQTGMMTSVARNILGLSKKGKLPNNTQIDGSVSFFGIDPDSDTQPVQIEVEYAGELYLGNQVHYTTNNGSWRLNFYGETENGRKFTDITRPFLGILGAFQNKILIFTRITSTKYKLEVLEESELYKLKDLSSIWARNGSSPLLYGYIK